MSESSKPLVVVVDDQQENLDVVTEVLARNGYETKTATTLSDARKLLAKSAPDLLILDRNLPDGDGFDLCREIRDGSRQPTMPVLFLTVRNKTAEIVHGLNLGADDYLPKPFGVQELEARVMAILRRATRPRPAPKAAVKRKAAKTKRRSR